MGDRHLEDLQNQALAEPQAELAAGSQTVLPVAGMTAEPAEPAADKTAGSLPAATDLLVFCLEAGWYQQRCR